MNGGVKARLLDAPVTGKTPDRGRPYGTLTKGKL
jgi:hypothetical protein